MNTIKQILSNENVRAGAKALGEAILTATLATFGVTWFSGCTSAAPRARGQTTEIVAVGIPAVAWITHSTQLDESHDSDTNATAVVTE